MLLRPDKKLQIKPSIGSRYRFERFWMTQDQGNFDFTSNSRMDRHPPLESWCERTISYLSA